jgi:two-component system, sensor histidine kinase and response regulator
MLSAGEPSRSQDPVTPSPGPVPAVMSPAPVAAPAELEPKGHIMVVDDQPANLKVLEDMLRNQGYHVRSFPRGRLALAAAAQNPPDLILLDINMPEMNGYDVCRKLKEESRLQDIPVIFLSALSDIADKLKAFRSGGVDYIGKPFQFEEVQARVSAHSRLHQLQQALRQQNERLEELVGVRTRELEEAHVRLKILDQAKTDFLRLIAHEFRTPLNGLLGVGQLLLDEPGRDDDLRDMFEQSRHRIMTILDDASILSQIQLGKREFECERFPIRPVLDQAIAQSAPFARSREVTLQSAHHETAFVYGVEGLLVKSLQSLVETAARFSSRGSEVRLTCRPADSGTDASPHVRAVGWDTQVLIESCGRTVPQALLPKFFDVFSISEMITSDGDFGLGPAVAHRILSMFGGSVAISNRDSSGIQLAVSLKSASDA